MTTHGHDCWSWGPKHYECAVRQVEQMAEALRIAEAALADIGDADREPGDDVAWCERRAAQALPAVRAAIHPTAAQDGKESFWPKLPGSGGPDWTGHD